ncbi:MAG: hypothetical protein ACL93V_15605 [Candidatus Electrothrix sp. YB6]
MTRSDTHKILLFLFGLLFLFSFVLSLRRDMRLKKKDFSKEDIHTTSMKAKKQKRCERCTWMDE